MNRCGGCEHAHPLAGDLTRRICRGAPPQIVVIQGQIQTGYPNVNVGDIACGAFKAADKKAELPDAVATFGEVDKMFREKFGDEDFDMAALAELRKKPEGSY